MCVSLACSLPPSSLSHSLPLSLPSSLSPSLPLSLPLSLPPSHPPSLPCPPSMQRSPFEHGCVGDPWKSSPALVWAMSSERDTRTPFPRGMPWPTSSKCISKALLMLVGSGWVWPPLSLFATSENKPGRIISYTSTLDLVPLAGELPFQCPLFHHLPTHILCKYGREPITRRYLVWTWFIYSCSYTLF